MIAAEALSFSYNPGREIFCGLNFEIPAGGILGVAGANGSGKSTLINILGGFMHPTGGRLVAAGLAGAEAVDYLSRHSAFLPQNIDHWILGETGREDLYLGVKSSEAEAVQAIEYQIKHWGVESFLDEPVDHLSLGQKKRLTLAAALSKNPKLILLDEPFSGLDWPGSLIMMDDLRKLKAAGVSAVIVTHEPGLLADVVDSWLLLGPPGQAFWGPPHEALRLLTSYGVRPV